MLPSDGEGCSAQREIIGNVQSRNQSNTRPCLKASLSDDHCKNVTFCGWKSQRILFNFLLHEKGTGSESSMTRGGGASAGQAYIGYSQLYNDRLCKLAGQ